MEKGKPADVVALGRLLKLQRLLGVERTNVGDGQVVVGQLVTQLAAGSQRDDQGNPGLFLDVLFKAVVVP